MDHSHVDIERRYFAMLDAFGDNISRFCVYCSENRTDAEDLMQEIFATIWMGLPGLDANSSPRQLNRWLYRVMRSTLIKHLRQRPRYSVVPDEELDIAFIIDESHRGLVADLAAHLPDGDQTLLNDYLEGYSVGEIAQRHGINTGTISVKMHRIRKKLKKIYYENYGNNL